MAVPPKVTLITVPGAAVSMPVVLSTPTVTNKSRLAPEPGVCEKASVAPLATEVLEPTVVAAAPITRLTLPISILL